MITQQAPDGNLGDASIRPFGQVAEFYCRAGWAPFPLPEGKKSPPPEGRTGEAGIDADADQVRLWITQSGNGNIGLRVPANVIGIDVDNYDGKAGGADLAVLEAKLGELPPTFISTSREDRVSGIRFFTVPAGLRWPGSLSNSVEILQWKHWRYARDVCTELLAESFDRVARRHSWPYSPSRTSARHGEFSWRHGAGLLALSAVYSSYAFSIAWHGAPRVRHRAGVERSDRRLLGRRPCVHLAAGQEFDPGRRQQRQLGSGRHVIGLLPLCVEPAVTLAARVHRRLNYGISMVPSRVSFSVP